MPDFLLNSFPWLGFLGSSIILTAILITATFYRGKRGEPYSPFNHFISELGEVGVSPAARVFNSGLILAGIALLPFVIGLGLYLPTFWGLLGLVAGLWTGVACILVGIFPMNNLTPHIKAAMGFFRGGLVMMVFFTIAILAQPVEQTVITPLAAIPGGLAVLTYAAFLVLGMRQDVAEQAETFLNPETMPERPRVWLLPLLEWLVFAATLGWLLAIALLI